MRRVSCAPVVSVNSIPENAILPTFVATAAPVVVLPSVIAEHGHDDDESGVLLLQVCVNRNISDIIHQRARNFT